MNKALRSVLGALFLEGHKMEQIFVIFFCHKFLKWEIEHVGVRDQEKVLPVAN